MIVSAIVSRIKAWNLYRETLSELSYLTDRELADIGVSRWEISHVAWKSAFTSAKSATRGHDNRPSAGFMGSPSFQNG